MTSNNSIFRVVSFQVCTACLLLLLYSLSDLILCSPTIDDSLSLQSSLPLAKVIPRLLGRIKLGPQVILYLFVFASFEFWVTA
jgi:hypothetical protein